MKGAATSRSSRLPLCRTSVDASADRRVLGGCVLPEQNTGNRRRHGRWSASLASGSTAGLPSSAWPRRGGLSKEVSRKLITARTIGFRSLQGKRCWTSQQCFPGEIAKGRKRERPNGAKEKGAGGWHGRVARVGRQATLELLPNRELALIRGATSCYSRNRRARSTLAMRLPPPGYNGQWSREGMARLRIGLRCPATQPGRST